MDKSGYQIEIINSIDKFVQSKTNDSGWYYEGVFLGPVIKRALYFKSLNNTKLQHIYISKVGEEGLPLPVYFNDELTYGVAKFIANDDKAVKLKKPFFEVLKSILKPYYYIIRIIADHVIYRSKKPTNNNIDVLLAPLANKHLKYILPVASIGRHKFGIMKNKNMNKIDIKLQASIKPLEWVPPRLRDLVLNFNKPTYLYRYIYNAAKIEQTINYYSPKALLFIEGDAPLDALFGLLSKKSGKKTICLQWGFPTTPSPKTGFRDIVCDYFFSWGEYFTDIYSNYNKKVNFISVGNHNIISPNSVNLNTKKIVFLSQKVSYFTMKNDIDTMFALFIEAAKKYHDYCFIIRPHPDEPLSLNDLKEVGTLPNANVHDSRIIKLSESLNGAMFSVTLNSSAVFDSIASKVVPLIYNNDDNMPDYQIVLESLGCAVINKTKIGIEKDLNRLLKDTEFRLNIQKNIETNLSSFFTFTGDNALNEIANKIVDVL